MMTLIKNNEEYAVIPMTDYKFMHLLKEDFNDALLIEKVKQEIKLGNDELIPLDIMKRLLSNESNLKIWREYRSLTPKILSDKTGVSLSIISKIENNKQKIDVPKLTKFATALNVNLDDLID
ncbi:Phage-related transcriptional regulator [Bathymodiolus heckerae thiotrophic gill symbiont]|uniref:helix-turn-helix domain-containing protein n=1 Tax=Bathymodiolus heckerae thiotrophic gill symbiont TaxID=1052212 RepID=UPI0010BA0C62|nr:helix-turn-helix transcriptional regulator [Bathymodiolus heckerae thiotrophic gill symbiont]SMN14177.1 Phage-related transcriptional regulator [Bathymodiolus heckerae thiotrophic gill symbiont]